MSTDADGFRFAEIDRHTDLLIRVHGYAVQQVIGDPCWTYTIGALESWGRPELLVVDLDAGVQRRLVAALGDELVAHGVVGEATLASLDLELLPVDGVHLAAGLVAMWEHRYSMAARRGDFVQIMPGPSWFCEECAGSVRRLDRP